MRCAAAGVHAFELDAHALAPRDALVVVCRVLLQPQLLHHVRELHGALLLDGDDARRHGGLQPRDRLLGEPQLVLREREPSKCALKLQLSICALSQVHVSRE